MVGECPAGERDVKMIIHSPPAVKHTLDLLPVQICGIRTGFRPGEVSCDRMNYRTSSNFIWKFMNELDKYI